MRKVGQRNFGFMGPGPAIRRIPSRLNGEPGNSVMKTADGRQCAVTEVNTFNVRAHDEKLESIIASIMEGNNYGYLPEHIGGLRYKIRVYVMEPIVPDDSQ